MYNINNMDMYYKMYREDRGKLTCETNDNNLFYVNFINGLERLSPIFSL